MLDVIRNEKRRTLDRPMTGVIWKDRIWEQWYDPELLRLPLPTMNQADYLFSCIEDMPERSFVNYRGKRSFTVQQFKKMVDTFSCAFAAQRLSVGDVICTISLTTPEMYAIKYAATALGLITCNLNVLDAELTDGGLNRLYRQIKNVNPQLLFVLDILEEHVAEILNLPEFSEVKKFRLPLNASIQRFSSESVAISFLQAKTRLAGKSIRGIRTLREFLSSGKSMTNVPRSVYSPGLPCNIAFTSGTTGINKAVLLSHDANNALAFQHKIAQLGFVPHERQLALVPPFLAFWDAVIVHTVLCLGAENIIELELSYEKIPEYIKKYRPQLGVWSQYLWDSIVHMPENDLKGICHTLRDVIIGGERCERNQAETFFKKTGIVQMTGFGASEVNTTFSICHPNCNKVGTAGIPLPHNNVRILGEHGEDVTYGKPGRLLITGPCIMNGYYGRDDLTEKVLVRDETGVVWYNTGDYAVMDSDGCLTVLDRDTAPISVICNGKEERVKLLDIAEEIRKNRNVKICKLTASNGKIVLHLVVDDFLGVSKKAAVASILATIQTTLPEKYWPDYIRVIKQLPRTPVGKVDYAALSASGIRIVNENTWSKKLTLLYE